ncbi:MAG: DoxX family protein [Candidatus Marinimicrobia bacterium]|nr:DoxX family protein [Candidatus Neomarinimicrobiota bacterium]
MNNLKTIGRIIYAIPFGIFGLMHMMMAGNMSGMVPAWVPGGIIWVYITGLALIAASVSIVTKKQIYLACLLLAGLLGVFVLTIHLPMLLSGDQMAMGGLLKDTISLGGALLIAGLFKDEN